jgi:hypothetical protein
MILFNNNHPTHFFSYCCILFILSSIDCSRQFPTKTPFSSKLKSEQYTKLAKLCYINDYSTWLHRQKEFMMWLDLARTLRLPIHEDKAFQRELKQYHLQYQCLRIVERLPISVGPG